MLSIQTIWGASPASTSRAVNATFGIPAPPFLPSLVEFAGSEQHRVRSRLVLDRPGDIRIDPAEGPDAVVRQERTQPFLVQHRDALSGERRDQDLTDLLQGRGGGARVVQRQDRDPHRGRRERRLLQVLRAGRAPAQQGGGQQQGRHGGPTGTISR
jgi:hypothetical protein